MIITKEHQEALIDNYIKKKYSIDQNSGFMDGVDAIMEMIGKKAEEKECKCKFCQTYSKYKWAVVMECGCACHVGDGVTGHEGLCCEFPNGLRKNNPHNNLKPSQYYRKILNDMEEEG